MGDKIMYSFFLASYTGADRLLRFDVELNNDQRDKGLPVAAKMAAMAIYNHAARAWPKNRCTPNPDPEVTGEVHRAWLNAHVTPNDVVAEPHHTFFSLAGFMWHCATDRRIPVFVKQYATRYAKRLVLQAKPGQGGPAAMLGEITMINILDNWGCRHNCPMAELSDADFDFLP